LPSPNQLSQTDTASLFPVLLPVQPPSLTDLTNSADPEVNQPLVRPTNSSSGMSSPSVSEIQVPTVLPLKQSLPPQETQAPLPMPVPFPIVTAQILTRTQRDPSSAQVPPNMQVVPVMQVVTRLNAASPLGTDPRPVSPIPRSQADAASSMVTASALPIVQAFNGSSSQAQLKAKADTPLVFSIPFSGPFPGTSIGPTNNGHLSPHPARSEMVKTSAQSVPRVSTQPMLNPQTSVSSPPPENRQQKIDLNDLANKVERKLMRRLVVERERRGRTQ
jgi:hypothetical protein